MSILQQLSDDQVALLSCVLAVLFCVGVLAVTPGVRQWASGMLKSKRTASSRLIRRHKHARTY